MTRTLVNINRWIKFLSLVSILIFSLLNAQAQAIAAVRIGGKWGYIDKQGSIAVPFKFDGIAERYYNGRAWAKKGNKFGYIDPKGKWAIKPKFDTVIDFNDGRGLVRKDTAWYMLDPKGKIVMKCISFDPYVMSLTRSGSFTTAAPASLPIRVMDLSI
jgi:hypothetical protein